MKSNLLAIVMVSACLARPALAGVEVSVFRIEDTRTKNFADDHVSRTPGGMKVTLSLRGPEAESSVRYGRLELEEAVDDQGSSLIPPKDGFNDASKFKDYENSFFRKSNFGGEARPADPQVDLTLASPTRAAAKISRLRGSLTLADPGTLKTVELANLKAPGKRTLAVPSEAQVGVTAELATGGNARTINLEITGDESLLESIEVLDGSGRKVSSGMSSWSFNGGPAHRALDLGKPVDDSMKLVAKFVVSRRLTTVPIDLKDIPLP